MFSFQFVKLQFQLTQKNLFLRFADIGLSNDLIFLTFVIHQVICFYLFHLFFLFCPFFLLSALIMLAVLIQPI